MRLSGTERTTTTQDANVFSMSPFLRRQRRRSIRLIRAWSWPTAVSDVALPPHVPIGARRPATEYSRKRSNPFVSKGYACHERLWRFPDTTAQEKLNGWGGGCSGGEEINFMDDGRRDFLAKGGVICCNWLDGNRTARFHIQMLDAAGIVERFVGTFQDRTGTLLGTRILIKIGVSHPENDQEKRYGHYGCEEKLPVHRFP